MLNNIVLRCMKTRAKFGEIESCSVNMLDVEEVKWMHAALPVSKTDRGKQKTWELSRRIEGSA